MNIKNNGLDVIQFYDCDVFDSFKDDIASMEHPIYSLSKTPGHRVLKYEKNGSTIQIKTGPDGLPTILDKDQYLRQTAKMILLRRNAFKVNLQLTKENLR